MPCNGGYLEPSLGRVKHGCVPSTVVAVVYVVMRVIFFLSFFFFAVLQFACNKKIVTLCNLRQVV